MNLWGMRIAGVALVWWLAAACPHALAAGFPGAQTKWHGYQQYDFKLGTIACRVVTPQKPAEGRPWIWRARFWGHEPQTERALLAHGFHVVYCDVSELWGNDEAVRRWSTCYRYLTSQHGFSSRPALLGMSRGGLMIYAWALKYPERLSCLYGDAPAMGIRPYVAGLPEGDPRLAKVANWMEAHSLTLRAAQTSGRDALFRAAALAAHRIPILHVCGDADESVPFKAHTAAFAERYQALGGPIRVIVKKGGKHHPHSLRDPAPIVSFIRSHQTAVAPQITHGPRLGHVTKTGATIWARLQSSGTAVLTAEPNGGGPAVTVRRAAEPGKDQCVHWVLQGLQPGTRYEYQIRRDGEALLQGRAFHFRTASAGRQGLTQIAFASCAREDDGSARVWRRMANRDPAALVLLGDTPYIDTPNLAEQRRRHREFAAVPAFRELLFHRRLYATWDDHDFGRNDTDGRLPGKGEARRAFMEYRTNPSYGDGQHGIYSSFRLGEVEVFLLDTRYFAATEPSPFVAEKPSLLGLAQWRWLEAALLESTATFKVLACGMIWNGAVRPGKRDHWETYQHERQALFEFIGRQKVTGVVLVGGDVHRTRVIQHDSRDAAGYRITELITSPVHGSVIANAKAPHPGLVADFGEPHSFLLISIDDGLEDRVLNVEFVGREGKPIYQLRFTETELRRS